MERVGINRIKKECDLFGENTVLRELSTKLVENVVSQGKWFSFCTRADKRQIDVIGLRNKEGVSLGNMIHEFYPELEYRTAIYKYLLSEFLCYYEAPIVTKDANTNGWKNSFNKFLVTSNIHVVAKWLDISYEDADAQFGAKFYGMEKDTTNFIPYLKLYETRDGVRKVTRTRKDLDVSLSGTRIIPVYALKTGVDMLYNCLLEDTYNVTFSKDSGQERVINVTFSVDKIRSIYDDNYVKQATDSWYMGTFEENPSFERGYIRVFEVGSSIYDSALRSINYARIISFEKAEPDLAFMYVDLDSVLEEFTRRVKGNIEISKHLKEVVEGLDMFNVGTKRTIGATDLKITSIQNLITWAEGQMTLLSTVFLRSLALFMLGNPQWFDGYTGSPSTYSAEDTGDWDDDLDLG